MGEISIIKRSDFNGISCDVYSDGNSIYMTRVQIGQALRYGEPRKMIAKLHERHRERLDKFSTVVSLGTVTGNKGTYLYNQRGIMEICRWSRQPLANQFMDWVWDIIEAYRDGTLANTPASYLTQEQVERIIDDKISQLRKEYLTLDNSCNNTNPLQSIVQDPISIIHATIEPLAKAYDDHSKGYNSTYRKVYEKMNIGWAYRLSRYKNQHSNKNKPSKIKLVAGDPKLLKTFIDATNELLSQI